MSKTSAKQRVTQLKEWLETRSRSNSSSTKPQKFSKSDHYKKVNKYYGSKEVN